MTEEAAAFTATIKAGAGYDAPWLVIRADSAALLKDRLREAYADLAAPLAMTAQVVQAEWAGPGPQPHAQPVAQAPTYQAPAPSAPQGDAPSGPAPTCVHGEMQFVSGKKGPKSKDPGGTWRAWACPTPKNTPGQCEKIWIY